MNNEQDTERPNETRLDSWKEIAEYLQRNTTTARRWEREEGLPVHRLSHKSRSSVYAYASEIDSWRASRKVVPESVPGRPLWKLPAFALTMVMCLIMVGNGVRPVAAQQSRDVSKRLICDGLCADLEANLSPDGRWMVKTDWDTGDLAIRDMSNGKMKRLMVKTGSFKESGEYAETPVFSPDMKQIVYLWETGKDALPQLRVAPNEAGGKPRVLIDNPEYEYYEPAAWSPDSKSVLVVLEKRDDTWQLAWVSASDGAVKQIVSLGWRIRSRGMKPNLSPDGRYIAYAALAVNPKSQKAPLESTDIRIYLVAADGSSGAELVKTAGINKNPAWTPDGKHLLFTSDRSGSLGLWSVAMKDGKPAGSPILVSANTGELLVMGMLSGSYYYTQGQNLSYIAIADLAPDGKTSGNGANSQGYPGLQPAWSPDGKFVAFKKRHPGNPETYELVVHSLETGEERTYTTKLGVTGFGDLAWFRDSNSILEGINGGGANSPYRVDLKSGEFTKVPSFGMPSMDGKKVYWVRRDPRDPSTVPDRIVAVDLESGREREVFVVPSPGATRLALSPNGRTLAMFRDDAQDKQRHFARVEVDGTGYREIYVTPGEGLGGVITWSADGRRILFEKIRDDSRLKWQVVSIPAEGGAPQPTGLEFDGSRLQQEQGLSVSPDGSHLAYVSRKSVSELWALDNVLSVLK